MVLVTLRIVIVFIETHIIIVITETMPLSATMVALAVRLRHAGGLIRLLRRLHLWLPMWCTVGIGKTVVVILINILTSVRIILIR